MRYFLTLACDGARLHGGESGWRPAVGARCEPCFILTRPLRSRLGIKTPLTCGATSLILYMSSIDMSKPKPTEVPYGTLDLLILKTLETMGKMHGYAIARRIEQVSGESMQLSQGSVYPALIRLQQEGWISTEWGISETNRKVRFYSLTRSGRKQLGIEVANWEKATALVARFLEPSS